ncbi:MAG: glycosyltransferase family 39 protein [Acidobacteria bacterium]|nr:glycosyltransferase family 39 protein [Acidobacteriota bacterium]
MSVSPALPARSLSTSVLAPPRRFARWPIAFPAILAVCLARLWVAPLGSSFWVDELVTRFVVRHGAGDNSLKVAPQVAESIYYVWPAVMERLFGFSETVYRLPSLIFMGAALWIVASIAKRSIHPRAGWFAVFTCLALRNFNYQAADARPYALGTMLAAFGFWMLARWLDRGSWRPGAAFALAGTLLWRTHLIYWPVYIGFAVYACYRLAARSARVPRLEVAAVFAVIGVSLAPVASTAMAIQRNAAAHVVADKPGLSDLTGALALNLVTPLCAAAALMARRHRWITPRLRMDWALIFCWWLCQPAGLFAFSWITGHSVFVGRYLFVSTPAAALAAVAAVMLFTPPRHLPRISAVAAGCVLVFGCHWGHRAVAHHNSDWRGAMVAINRSNRTGAPVICPSPFIEAKPPVWRPDYPLNSFLYSHLDTYNVDGVKYPFPFEQSEEAERAAAKLTRSVLARSQRFYILGGDHAVRAWRDWFTARPELTGWTATPLGDFRDVEALLMEPPSDPANTH